MYTSLCDIAICSIDIMCSRYVFQLCRCVKSWRKSRGKRSKARIGLRRKTSIKKERLELPKPVHPSHWVPQVVVPEGWMNVFNENELKLCQISKQKVPNTPPLVVTRSLVVMSDQSWMLHVHSHHVNPTHISSLLETPSFLDPASTTLLLQAVCHLNTCVGNPDTRFTDLAMSKKNGRFLSSKKGIAAYLDTGFCISVGDQEYSSTVRCSSCHLLTDVVLVLVIARL